MPSQAAGSQVVGGRLEVAIDEDALLIGFMALPVMWAVLRCFKAHTQLFGSSNEDSPDSRDH